MFKLKPMARAVHNALQYIGEQWRREQWRREQWRREQWHREHAEGMK